MTRFVSGRPKWKPPVRPLRVPAWPEQEGTWRAAKPAVIDAALRRASSRPSGNWYVLAASREVTGQRPLGRTVAGTELVAWRTGEGRAVVGPGACPHLGAPLAEGRVHGDRLLCRWHGMALGERGEGRWCPLPSHDDGVLLWVRLDAAGDEEPLPAPVVPERPALASSIDAVMTVVGECAPEDVVANRLDPWHGSWFHPYSFANLRVLHAPSLTATDEDDVFDVEVTFRLSRRVGVPVRARFTAPEPRTVVMRITEGEGEGSVVETHATPLGTSRAGRPLTAVIEATVACSPRPGFRIAARAGAPVARVLMRWAAARLWRDDLAYAERRSRLRTNDHRLG